MITSATSSPGSASASHASQIWVNLNSKSADCFPTPHELAELIVQMTIGMSDGDLRDLTVCDPRVGTGRLLIHASNHSLRLYGQEINPLLCLTTRWSMAISAHPGLCTRFPIWIGSNIFQVAAESSLLRSALAFTNREL